jgi:hypothetical protein
MPHGRRIVLLRIDCETMPDVAAADRHSFQSDQALSVIGSRRLCFQEFEELGADESGRFHPVLFSLVNISEPGKGS